MRSLSRFLATAAVLAVAIPCSAQPSPPPSPPPPGAPALPPPGAPPAATSPTPPPVNGPVTQAPPAYPPPGYPPPGYPPPPPPPGQGAPPPAEMPQGGHRHDGFYLRLATGFGAYEERILRKGDSNVATLTGVGTSTELAIGGTVGGKGSEDAGSTAIGAGVYSLSVLAASFRTGAADAPPSVTRGDSSFTLLGPFLDHYFNAQKGLHFQFALGFASLRDIDPASASTERGGRAYGAGMMFGVGSEWWVGEQWSVGVLGRITGAWTTNSEEGTRYHHFVSSAPSVLFTVTYH